MDSKDPDLPENDPKYAVSLLINSWNFYEKLIIKHLKIKGLDKSVLPRTECLKDTVERFLPFWHDQIVPALKVIQNLNFISWKFLCISEGHIFIIDIDI